MRVLLTGSAGFIGRSLCRELTEHGHSVTQIDKGIDARIFFREDCSRNHHDLVIHCAAVVGGRVLIETPMAHAQNLEIDATLFQWAERAHPGRIVYVSSVAAYPVGLQKARYALHEHDIDLADTCAPDELYGWAKLTGEVLASRSSVPVSVVRPFTVYGEDQDPVFPFASIALQFRERRNPVTVWGTGNQVRDFIHVTDVAKAILVMAEKEINTTVNLCTGRATSLRELIALFSDQAGYYPDIQVVDKPEGLTYRVGSPEKLHEFYPPEVSLEEGIRRALKGP